MQPLINLAQLDLALLVVGPTEIVLVLLIVLLLFRKSHACNK